MRVLPWRGGCYCLLMCLHVAMERPATRCTGATRPSGCARLLSLHRTATHAGDGCAQRRRPGAASAGAASPSSHACSGAGKSTGASSPCPGPLSHAEQPQATCAW